MSENFALRLWRDPIDGHIWVLEFVEGTITACGGPVDHGEITTALDTVNLERDPGLSRGIRGRYSRFA